MLIGSPTQALDGHAQSARRFGEGQECGQRHQWRILAHGDLAVSYLQPLFSTTMTTNAIGMPKMWLSTNLCRVSRGPLQLGHLGPTYGAERRRGEKGTGIFLRWAGRTGRYTALTLNNRSPRVLSPRAR